MATEHNPTLPQGSENEDRIENSNLPSDLGNQSNDPLVSNPPMTDPEVIKTVTLPRTTLDALKGQIDSLHEKLMNLTSSQTQSDNLVAQLIKDNEALRMQEQVSAQRSPRQEEGGHRVVSTWINLLRLDLVITGTLGLRIGSWRLDNHHGSALRRATGQPQLLPFRLPSPLALLRVWRRKIRSQTHWLSYNR